MPSPVSLSWCAPRAPRPRSRRSPASRCASARSVGSAVDSGPGTLSNRNTVQPCAFCVQPVSKARLADGRPFSAGFAAVCCGRSRPSRTASMMSSEGNTQGKEAKRSEGSSGRAFRGPKRRSKDSRSKTRHLAEELFTATSERDTPFQPREGCGAALVRSHVLRAPPSQCGFRSPGEPSLQRTAQFLRLPSVQVTGVARLVKQLGFCFFEAERPLFILASSVATASPSCARVCSRLPPPFRLGLQPQEVAESLSL